MSCLRWINAFASILRLDEIKAYSQATVYRLVSKGSIEEKILALHGRKRDLAENLLSGSDLAGRISSADLICLIQGDVAEESL